MLMDVHPWHQPLRCCASAPFALVLQSPAVLAELVVAAGSSEPVGNVAALLAG